MNCPVDGTTLVMTERQGVEIDYCPSCRGVWLDRGELDKLIERSAGVAGQPVPPQPQHQPAPPPAYPTQPYPTQPYPPQPHGPGYGKPHHKKRRSFLEDIFDF